MPLVKIVVSGAALPELDNSVMPVPGQQLRSMPVIPPANAQGALPHATFTLKKTGKNGDEGMWVINDLPFDALAPLLTVTKDQPIIWTNANGGGGWVHPMHMHMEEHPVISRGRAA